MSLPLAIAILDENLKGPTATFDEMGLSAVRWAWTVVRAEVAQAGTARSSQQPREETLSPTGGGR